MTDLPKNKVEPDPPLRFETTPEAAEFCRLIATVLRRLESPIEGNEPAAQAINHDP